MCLRMQSMLPIEKYTLQFLCTQGSAVVYSAAVVEAACYQCLGLLITAACLTSCGMCELPSFLTGNYW